MENLKVKKIVFFMFLHTVVLLNTLGKIVRDRSQVTLILRDNRFWKQVT